MKLRRVTRNFSSEDRDNERYAYIHSDGDDYHRVMAGPMDFGREDELLTVTKTYDAAEQAAAAWVDSGDKGKKGSA